LPQVDPQLVADCKASNPRFGQGNLPPTVPPAQPLPAAPAPPVTRASCSAHFVNKANAMLQDYLEKSRAPGGCRRILRQRQYLRPRDGHEGWEQPRSGHAQDDLRHGLSAEGLQFDPPRLRDCTRESGYRRPGGEIPGRGRRQKGVAGIRFIEAHRGALKLPVLLARAIGMTHEELFRENDDHAVGMAWEE
jgi:hypothetical protein